MRRNGLIGLVLAGCVCAPLRAQQPSASPPSSSDTGGVLHSGDVVRLRIWREPDLSGDFAVDERGVAVFPKIGPMMVQKQSPESLEARLVKSLSAYLRNPSVEVVLLRRVQVLGAVRNPGLYTVDPTMSVSDALALAGGVDENGKSNQVHLIRRGERLTVNVSQRTRIADTPIQSGDQLFVPQRGWISRNPAALAGVLTAAAGIIVTLVAR
jgi:protein involved in polysaccharide export with SLBB domain